MVNGARPLDAPLAQLLAGALKRLPMPGVAAGVCRAAEVLGLAVSGVRRLGGDEPMRITDRLAIGSNAKAFTAMLIATLVEEGTMAWEMNVSDVFPELRAVTRDEHRALVFGRSDDVQGALKTTLWLERTFGRPSRDASIEDPTKDAEVAS